MNTICNNIINHSGKGKTVKKKKVPLTETDRGWEQTCLGKHWQRDIDTDKGFSVKECMMKLDDE